MHGFIKKVQKGHARQIAAMHWYELAEGVLRADDRRRDEMKGLTMFVLSYLAETSCIVCAEPLGMEAVLPCSQMAQSLSLLATRMCVGILHGRHIVDRQRSVMMLAYHLAVERIPRVYGTSIKHKFHQHVRLPSCFSFSGGTGLGCIAEDPPSRISVVFTSCDSQ